MYRVVFLNVCYQIYYYVLCDVIKYYLKLMLYLILIFNNDFGFYDNDLFYFLDNLG